MGWLPLLRQPAVPRLGFLHHLLISLAIGLYPLLLYVFPSVPCRLHARPYRRRRAVGRPRSLASASAPPSRPSDDVNFRRAAT